MLNKVQKQAIKEPIRTVFDLAGPRNIKWLSADRRFSFCFYVNK